MKKLITVLSLCFCTISANAYDRYHRPVYNANSQYVAYQSGYNTAKAEYRREVMMLTLVAVVVIAVIYSEHSKNNW